MADIGCMREEEQLGDVEMLALLTAALCHDLNHPGNTNSLEMSTVSELAILYSDRSVLESHSAATGYTLLLQRGLLRGLSPAETTAFRKCFVTASAL